MVRAMLELVGFKRTVVFAGPFELPTSTRMKRI